MATGMRRRPDSAKLAGFKHDLYHPRLPTLRKMDMDNATYKLPTEHSRTTTFSTKADFDECRTVNFTWIDSHRRQRAHCLNYLGTEAKEALNASKPIDLQEYTKRWKETMLKVNTFQSQLDSTSSSPFSTSVNATGPFREDDQQRKNPKGTINLGSTGYTTRPDRPGPGFDKSWQLFSRHRKQFLKPRPATATLSRLY